jgi:hypothetical protein
VRKDRAWIQDQDTEPDYSHTEYGKNILVFGGGGDVENSLAMLIQESERLSTTKGEGRSCGMV